MHVLGLDVGIKHTGVAFGDTVAGFVVAKETIHHATDEELLQGIARYVTELAPAYIVLGLPLLPQGEEGTQSAHVRTIAARITETFHVPVRLIDERYSSVASSVCRDDHAMAACAIVEIALSQLKKSN